MAKTDVHTLVIVQRMKQRTWAERLWEHRGSVPSLTWDVSCGVGDRMEEECG